jgi:hypothetical protein
VAVLKRRARHAVRPESGLSRHEAAGQDAPQLLLVRALAYLFREKPCLPIKASGVSASDQLPARQE